MSECGDLIRLSDQPDFMLVLDPPACIHGWKEGFPIGGEIGEGGYGLLAFVEDIDRICLVVLESPSVDVFPERRVVLCVVDIVPRFQQLASSSHSCREKSCVPFPCLFHGDCWTIPDRSMQVEVRHIESQQIGPDVVGQVTVRLIDAAEVVEVAFLAESAYLIGVGEQLGLLSDQVDEAMADIELGGHSSGMLLG